MLKAFADNKLVTKREEYVSEGVEKNVEQEDAC